MANQEYLIIKNLSSKERNRIFNKIYIEPFSQCWNWIGKPDQGYGRIYYRGHREKAHRFFYALFIKPIPKGINPQLHHSCNNGKCCNPDHLQLLDLKTHVLKGNSPPAINSKKIYCIHGHLLPIKKNRRGERSCKICFNKYDRSEQRHKWKRNYYNNHYKIPKRTHCKKGHLLPTESNRTDCVGGRRCKICDSIVHHERYLKKKTKDIYLGL